MVNENVFSLLRIPYCNNNNILNPKLAVNAAQQSLLQTLSGGRLDSKAVS